MKLRITADYGENAHIKESIFVKYIILNTDVTLSFFKEKLFIEFDVPEFDNNLKLKIKETLPPKKLEYNELIDYYTNVLGDNLEDVNNIISKGRNLYNHINDVLTFYFNTRILFLAKQEYYAIIDNRIYNLYPRLKVAGDASLILTVNKHNSRKLENYFKCTPLRAFRVLSDSYEQPNLKERWICITMAAELGIKEFYSRVKPELNPLLDKMQSPNLKTLYGSLLNDYMGYKSPNLSAIEKGIQIRNKFIHSNDDVPIEADKVYEYAVKIKECLLFLQEKLSGEDHVIVNKNTNGEWLYYGKNRGKIELTKEQRNLIANGNAIGNFPAKIYEF